MRRLAAQMFRFGLVGLFNIGVDAAVFFSAIAALRAFRPEAPDDWNIIVANTASWLVAVTSSYVLNSRFTFRKGRGDLSFRGYVIFAATQIGGFLAHTAMLVIAAKYFPLPVAKAFGIGVGFVVNFALARALVFRGA